MSELAKIVVPTLYEVEDDLLALLNTEDEVDPELEEAFRRDLARQLQAAVVKRDRVGGFIKMCEYTAEQTANEIRRLSARKRSFENAADRLRSMVVWIIEALGKDDKGKLRKLQGSHFTLSARSCPNTLKIEYESLVPEAYKRVRVDMPAEQWAMICQGLKEPFPVATYYIDSAVLKAALESGIKVEGASLETDRVTLQIR